MATVVGDSVWDQSTEGELMAGDGYWQSTWPVECGDNHRPKAVSGLGLDIGPTDRLVATSRSTGRWPVMFVQRDVGELYLHGTTLGRDPVAGWVERVDPLTLAPIETSGELAAGGHEWCGSVSVHANGDLYTVNGSHLHRLDPHCSVVAEQTLPVDHAHNGLLILDDGSIVTKDIRLGDINSTLTVCDPDLNIVASTELPEPSMGRIAATVAVTGEGQHLYVPGTTRVFRYRWLDSTLTIDPSWQPRYRNGANGGMAWDPTIVGSRVWFMDNGNVPGVELRVSENTNRPASGSRNGNVADRPPQWEEPVRVFGVSIDNADDVMELTPTEHPAGWVIAPPLVFDDIVVAWDTGNGGIAAFELRPGQADSKTASATRSGIQTDMLWYQPFRTSMQPLLHQDSEELVINDFRRLDDGRTSDDLVVLDLRTGRMKARVETGGKRMNGMFLCPGWDRDLYYCTFDTVARVRAESL